MHIVETFPAPKSKAGHLFWLPSYIRLARAVYVGYIGTGERSEAARYLSNCASRWGITRACAEAILTGEATHTVTPLYITIKRPVRAEA